MNATYKTADESIAAYDAYVFTSVGRSFDTNKADSLAAVAWVDCEVASKDRSVNSVTRAYYKTQAEIFKNIA